jgi:hypothetical protein
MELGLTEVLDSVECSLLTTSRFKAVSSLTSRSSNGVGAQVNSGEKPSFEWRLTQVERESRKI